MILAIDPGDKQSAYCIIEEVTYKPIEFGKINNEDLIRNIQSLIKKYGVFALAIEMIASYGMPVGKEVFDTCVWIGRYYERSMFFVGDISYVYRKDVKMNLCNSMRAKDSNIRQALIDRFGTVGTKKNQGWFYGFKADIWSAYAVGITYLDSLREVVNE